MLPCTEWAVLDRPCASTKDWLLPDDIQASAVTIYLSISIKFSFTDEGTLRERERRRNNYCATRRLNGSDCFCLIDRAAARLWG